MFSNEDEGSFKLPSCPSGNDCRLKLAAFSNRVKMILNIKSVYVLEKQKKVIIG